MNISTFLSGEIAQFINGLGGTSAPTSLTVALSVADPLADGSGLVEPSVSDGYSRQSLTLTPPVCTPGAGTSSYNNMPLIFGPVVNNAWPTITHIAVFDGTGTNMLFHGELNVQRAAPVGDEISMAVNAIQIQTKDYYSDFFGKMILNYLRGTDFPTPPITTDLALSLTNPSQDGSTIDEPVLGYTRQPITFVTTSVTNSGRILTSNGPYIFGPADVSWGLITHSALFTDAGDMLFFGPVAVQRTVGEDDSFAVPFGALTLLLT